MAKAENGKTYKWAHPSEWLNDYITELAQRGDVETLAFTARELAEKLDGDQIQDIYQQVMDCDGYFTAEVETDDDDAAEVQS